ncbi:MAG TPA: hypothetical protein VH206_01205 [Xanthobacteraceae bacterium]|nr:hypothetical protein [Xanthobacteraceae bacterium]
MDQALAQIGAGFGEAAAVNRFKLRIEFWMRAGPQHRAVRARFGRRAERLLGLDLDGAVFAVERTWREERKAFQIASAFGRGNRLGMMVLSELRLILRLMRRRRMQGEFGAVVAMACDLEMAEAAE